MKGEQHDYNSAERKFHPPGKHLAYYLQLPLNLYFKPSFYGFDQVDPNKPALFISNHTYMWLTDGVFIVSQFYLKHDLILRGLVHDMHYKVPLWGNMMNIVGGLKANRKNATDLMQQGQHILLFPGGSREAFKPKKDVYHLLWKNRLGFVKLAIENKYPIIPIASFGGDEAYEVLYDNQDFMNSMLGRWLNKTGIANKYLEGGELIPPLTRGLAGLPFVPKRNKLYFSAGKPIETKGFRGKLPDEKGLIKFREKVEASIYDQIENLRYIRDLENQ